MSFSDNLKRIRIEKGMSQQELAKEIGVSQTAIYQWEKGTRTPKIDAITKLVNALNVKPTEFFKEKRDGEEIIEITLPGISADNITDYLNAIVPEYIDASRKEQDLFLSIDNKNNILDIMEQLNLDGQKKAIEQLKLLAKIPDYQKEIAVSQAAYDSLNPHKEVSEEQKKLAKENGVTLPEWEDAGRGIGKDPEGSEQ